jgi:hypothetical protein
MIDEEYDFYILPKEDPIDVEIRINGEKKNTFGNPAVPYNVEIETRTVFEDELVESKAVLEEVKGNNLFMPAVDAGYKTSSSLNLKTSSGAKEVLIVPTKYQSEGYEFNVMAEGRKVEQLEVKSGSLIKDEGRLSEVGLDEYSTEYKEGVNSLRPVADCLFASNEQGKYYEIPVNAADSYNLIQGRPYVINIKDSDVEKYQLNESRSQLVLSPARVDGFGNTSHQGKNRFSADKKVIITPTVITDSEKTIKLTTYDSTGNKLYTVDFKSPDVGVCAEESSLNKITYSNDSSFEQRINSIRPVLDSMFIAGN